MCNLVPQLLKDANCTYSKQSKICKSATFLFYFPNKIALKKVQKF